MARGSAEWGRFCWVLGFPAADFGDVLGFLGHGLI